ncbi:MAG: hypothetical protein Q6360_13165 [Candidatus Brocadiales bacterium]|nr:hypothetical protein [Candidatus Brocadiales bacterium]
MNTDKPKHKPFIRLGWDEVWELMQDILKEKYKATGNVTMKKDYHYDGIGQHYDMPTYVDIEL